MRAVFCLGSLRRAGLYVVDKVEFLGKLSRVPRLRTKLSQQDTGFLVIITHVDDLF